MQGFCEVDLIEVGYVARLNTGSRHLRQVERCLHTSRQCLADKKFRSTFGEGLVLRHDPGSPM